MNQAALRALRVAVVVMGVLIVAGVVGLVAAVVHRGGSRAPVVAAPSPGVALPEPVLPDLVLDEPAGSHISGVTQGEGRMAVTVQGGGPDRLVVVDARTGRVVQRLRLAR